MRKYIYKYELHLHSSETSACCSSTGAEMAEKYKEEGFDGVFFTDHFFNGNCSVSNDYPWAQRVDLFCKGYENAKKKGDKIGLKVFFSWEYSYDGSDFLTYGLDKQWLLLHEEIMYMRISEYLDLVHKSGGFIIHAHPFRERNYIERINLLPRHVDAVEIYNGGHYPNFEEFNVRAAQYAKSYNLPVTAGSDNHSALGNITGGIVTSEPIETTNDLINTIRSGDYKLYWLEEILDK